MHRTIAAAALVLSFIAFVLHKSSNAHPIEEPLLLLAMGSLFLLVGKLVSPAPRLQPKTQPQPVLEREAKSAA